MADLYFSSTAGGDTSGDNSACWFEDSAYTTPHNTVPTTGDNGLIYEGTCSGFSFNCDSVNIYAGVTLTSLTIAVPLIYNQGTITTVGRGSL